MTFKNKLIARSKALVAGNNILLVVTIMLFFLLYIIGMLFVPRANFTSPQTFFTILKNNAGLFVITASMTLVMIVGGIDISVGSFVAVSCTLTAFLIERQGFNMWQAFAVVIICGLMYGALEGLLIAYLKIQPFIVTLAGLILWRGMTSVISEQGINIENEQFKEFANAQIEMPFTYINKKGNAVHPYVFWYVVYAIIIVVLVYLLLRHTRFGRNIYAVGGNEQSALLLGINVRRTKFFAYVTNGFLISLGSMIYCFVSSAGSINVAVGVEMDAIAGSVIGGTLLTGGVGNVFGSLFGVLIRGIISLFITSSGKLDVWWARIAISALLALFIILQSVVVSIREKNKKGK